MRLQQASPEALARMFPLLRSIAKEVVERSYTIVQLEDETRALEGAHATGSVDVLELVSRLANHKRELRHSVEELRELGWERDPEQPLRFRSKGAGAGETFTWSPEDSFFYRSAQI